MCGARTMDGPLRVRRASSYLAAGTPVRGAGVGALWMRADWSPAARAGAPCAAMNAAERPRACDAREHRDVRVPERREQVVVGDLGERPPRRNAGLPQTLGFPHVPDPGHEPLVEQRVPDLAVAAGCAQVDEHRLEVRRLVQNVRAEAAQAGGAAKLEGGAGPQDALVR